MKRAGWAALAATLALTAPAPAQRNTPKVLKAFASVAEKPGASTVRILSDGKEVALGAVVGTEGWVLTKHSDLAGTTVVRLTDGKELPARLVGVHPKHDLALLKVEARGLKVIEWRKSTDAEVGDWLVSPGVGKEGAIAVGVMSVATRRPAKFDMPVPRPNPNSGFLGVLLEDNEDSKARIAEVNKNSAAEKAGLKARDVVLSVSNKQIQGTDSLIETLGGYKPGDEVVLKVRRGEEVLELKAKLDKRPAAPRGFFDRSDFQNRMGSELSKRRGGFTIIFQHDTVLRPRDCGGPLVGLDGKALGINIARAGRTETYAIPAEAILEVLPDLQSGKLPPPPPVDVNPGKSTPAKDKEGPKKEK